MARCDVFLSHNSEDKEQVLAIAKRLRAENVVPWVDEWDLVPGAAWQDGLVQGVESATCTAIFVGPNGVGSWQNAEAMLILNRAFTDPSYRLIPVLLPGATGDPAALFPRFITLFTWVDFRGGVDDPEALRRLVAGVRGEAPGPAPRQLEPPHEPLRLADLDRCLAALGVPEPDLPVVARWLAERISNLESQVAPPDAGWSTQVSDAVSEFQRNLELFAWPECLLAGCFYLSTSKLARMYRAYRHHLGNDEDPADRFRSLHRFQSGRHRLAFGPSLLLLGEQLPAGDDTWLYFTGSFTITLDESVLTAVPDARKIINMADRQNMYNLVGQIFGPTDPFFLPIIELTGSFGTHPVTMLMSRKYVGVESYSATALGSALLGKPIRIYGFGTLAGQELQPVVCTTSSDWW